MGKHSKHWFNKKQRGMALMLTVFLVAMVALTVVLKTANDRQQTHDEKTMQTLSAAKKALIAWSANHPNVPGLMPYPDRNGDKNYDGSSDCYATNVSFSPAFTIGQLPLFQNDPNCINAKVTATTGLEEDFRDKSGERLWVEVSKNLLFDYNGTGTAPIINPSIINTPTDPWFTVRDRSGNILSSRVAAVIIAPGEPLPNQNRNGGIANANQYLDKIVMADGTPYQNYGVQVAGVTPVQEFIIGDDWTHVSKTDPTYKNQTIEPYRFNDQLVYITIDELMAAVEKRVAMSAKNALLQYRTNDASNNFPDAAMFGIHKNYSCIDNKSTGALPVEPSRPTTCSYNASSSSSSITCNLNDVTSVTFTRSTSTSFTSASGACRFSGNNCVCTNSGSCTRGTINFTCNVSGCSANTGGTYQMSGIASDIITGKCSSICGTDVSCTGTGTGAFLHSTCHMTNSLTLPSWFTAHQWQKFIYYDKRGGLMSGGESGINALIVTEGASIIHSPFALSKNALQVESSCHLNDHLDSIENTNLDATFEATSKAKSANYNDQVFKVDP